MLKTIISKKIVGFEVVTPEAKANEALAAAAADESDAVARLESTLADHRAHEAELLKQLKALSMPASRPSKLIGSTYKIKPPMADHAIYITINDVVMNEGTPDQCVRPFEIFINSKDVEHYQWIVALTRVMSGVFRKGGDITFLVEELFSVFDPKGGYLKKGGVYMPSLVAEIGDVLKQHLTEIGMINAPELDVHQQQLIESKKKEFTEKTGEDVSAGGFPSSAQVCPKCSTKAMVRLDNCMTCLNCGDSKCG